MPVENVLIADDKLDKSWNNLKEFLQLNISPAAFQMFNSSAKPLSLKNDILTIQVSNEFSKNWLKEKCEDLMISFFKSLGFETFLITYKVLKEQQKPTEQLSILLEKPLRIPQKEMIKSTGFNEKYTFDNFIPGYNNRFAYAASEAVAKAPARAYNPLFIYGNVGLGKTHLMHSIGLSILETNPAAKIALVSSEKFTNELINAIKNKSVDQFRTKYRSLDVLLVDDIQFLAGKTQTQEEFFHTFNDLHMNNKQIILTSDRTPKEIPTLELRLRTRFEWGLIADIQPPEFETRIAILRKKTELNNFDISDEILHFIATQFPSNVREMEGALTRIVAYSKLLQSEITLSVASNVIKDIVGIKLEKPLTIPHIRRKVSEFFNIPVSDLVSKSRTKEISYARQMAMYLTRELTNVSLPKIGESFGKRDHTTVMHACDKIKGLVANDPETKQLFNSLISNIKNDG